MTTFAKTSQKLAIPTLEQFTSVKNSVVQVGTSAEVIPASNMDYRKGLFIHNAESTGTYLYIGSSSSVTADETAATGGFKLDGGSTMFLTLDASCTLYGISASGDVTCHFLEVA